MDQQYCLKWSNHLSNLSNVFLSLLEREALCDVTLSVGVEQKIKAHQTMLSACSPYFESLFIEHTHPNPIVHLNVEFEDLKAIIEYIYKGEVNIAHTCLPRFLKAANDLQVKGLVDTNKDYKNESHSETNSPKSSPIPPDTDSNIDDFKNDTRERHEFDRHHRESFNNNDDYSYSRKSDSETRLDDEPRHLLLGKRNRQRSQDCDNSLLTHKPHPYPPRHLSDSSQELHASPKPKSRRMISIEGNDSDGRRTSPISNSANISPSRLPQINIKRENSEPMLSMPKYLQQMSGHRGLDDLPNNLLPSHEGHENDNPIPHPDPSNDIDDLNDRSNQKAMYMRMTFERIAGGCNLHRCKLCGKVVTHIRNHYHVHFPGRFECPLCRATYTRSDNLRTHCKFKHPMFNPDTRKFENLMNTTIASQTAAIAAIAAANSINAAASLNAASSHSQSSE